MLLSFSPGQKLPRCMAKNLLPERTTFQVLRKAKSSAGGSSHCFSFSARMFIKAAKDLSPQRCLVIDNRSFRSTNSALRFGTSSAPSCYRLLGESCWHKHAKLQACRALRRRPRTLHDRKHPATKKARPLQFGDLQGCACRTEQPNMLSLSPRLRQPTGLGSRLWI